MCRIRGARFYERGFINLELAISYFPNETFAVLEATRNWPFMYDLLSDHVIRVELAHSKEVKAITNAAVKTCLPDIVKPDFWASYFL